LITARALIFFAALKAAAALLVLPP